MPYVVHDRPCVNDIKFRKKVRKDVKIVAVRTGVIAALQLKCCAIRGSMNTIQAFAAPPLVIHPAHHWLFKIYAKSDGRGST